MKFVFLSKNFVKENTKFTICPNSFDPIFEHQCWRHNIAKIQTKSLILLQLCSEWYCGCLTSQFMCFRARLEINSSCLLCSIRRTKDETNTILLFHFNSSWTRPLSKTKHSTNSNTQLHKPWVNINRKKKCYNFSGIMKAITKLFDFNTNELVTFTFSPIKRTSPSACRKKTSILNGIHSFNMKID